LGGRGHWVAMLGADKGKVNAKGIAVQSS
jgi:hypothetical protein